MKKITTTLSVCFILFFSSCKKETDVIDGLSVRCNDFESSDCLLNNWAWGQNDKVQITEGSHDGSRCLFITTDSIQPRQNVYTFVDGFDSNQVYRITFYAKYKKVLAHLPYQGHTINIGMNTAGLNFTLFNLNSNHTEPIIQDWEKYSAIFQSSRDIPAQLTISVTDMDSVWIDNILINKF